MSWTQQIQHKAIDAYWANPSNPKCPVCGGILDVKYNDGVSYTLTVNCIQCHESFASRMGNDPMASQFRAYTQGEIDDIAKQYLKTRTATCPIDKAEIDFSSTRPEGNQTRVNGTCLRCHGNAQKLV